MKPQVRGDALSFPELKTLIGREDPVILEIGANDGLHSAMMLKAFPQCRLYCFEPDPRAIRKWRSRIGDRARLIESAVGAADGPVTFHPSAGSRPNRDPEGFDQAGSIRRPDLKLLQQTWPWLQFGDPVEVECVRLDNWSASEGILQIDLVWADVQGAERDLIEGGSRTLANARYIYTEHLPREYYRGCMNLDEIAASLPQHHLMMKFEWDALFINKSEPIESA